MPNDTSFALLYKKLIDRNFDADTEALARTRGNLIAQLSAHSPPIMQSRLWTKRSKYDIIHQTIDSGEETK